MPAKNVSLTEWNNSDKEQANDENIKGTVHARIQAKGGQAKDMKGRAQRRRPEHSGGGQNTRGGLEQALFNWVKSQRRQTLGC